MKRAGPMLADDKAAAVEEMFDRIAPRYDLMNRVLTWGMDAGWRRRAVRELALPLGSRVLDLACGTGDLCRELERAGHEPVGFDFSRRMLAAARTRAPLVRADVLALPVPDGAADGVTCGFALRNVADLGAFFREVARVLRPGGRMSFLEVAAPTLAPLRWGHDLYFNRVVPLVGGLLSDREAYRYLPASVAYLPEPAAMAEMLQAAGLGQVRRATVGLGAAQVIVGTRMGGQA